MKIKVTPIKGICKAPYFVIDVDAKEKFPHNVAIDNASKMSRLSDFGWNFVTELI